MRISKQSLQILTINILIVISLTIKINAQAYQGYTLFGPHNTTNTYLVNMNNTVVKSWTHSRSGGYSAYLLEDGSVLRTAMSSSSALNGGGAQGVVQRYSWSGTLTWEYTYSTTTYRAHHDIEPMPNGNVLIIAWEKKTAAQAVQAGLNHSAEIWPDHIIEVQPVGTNGGVIVWQWHAWDHLIQDYNSTKDNYGVVANHPELFDINVESAGSGDWLHINGISYIPSLDQIVISSHELDEIYVIDHSTTTQQAASHTGGNSGKGGDILYRWGRPSNYRASGSQVFNVVHCAYWIPDSLPGGGNIMAFNNREGTGSSMVVEIVPPRDVNGNYIYTAGTGYGPSSPVWSYSASGFYSNHLGGCQRLPNGNTLIVQSTSGKMLEVNSSGTVVWSYNRGGEIVRALRYGIGYAGLAYLPVLLKLFGAVIINDKINLEWKTSTETNNFGFEILRSSNNVDFTKIDFVLGAGTSTEEKSYFYIDEFAFSGKYYYKLRQIDFDGSSNYSDVVEVNFDITLDFILNQNYPNPFNPSTKISWQSPVTGWHVLKVFDILANEIITLVNEYKPAGRYEVELNMANKNLSSGIYFYRLTASNQAGNFIQTKQMMLVK